MAELMVAVVILGIGLLITSSMFPIAWLKARDVAEATNVSTTALAAEVHMEMLLRVNGPLVVHPPDRSPSSFFPGDWFSGRVIGQDYDAGVYPDTRAHFLNTGNYGIGYAIAEADRLDPLEMAPVADNGWRLDENIALVVQPGAGGATFADLENSGADKAVIAPHVRLVPPMEEIPIQANDPIAYRLWTEQFETRRHCWAVFYRMSEIPGPDLALQSECQISGTRCNELQNQAAPSLRRPRRMTMYYVTLKRPANGRYARQQGNDGNGAQLDIIMPRAMAPPDDVLLPTPWRFEALITNATLPTDGDQPQTGIPTEIEVTDVVISDMVQKGSYLIDDRNGEVFRVAARKEEALPSTRVVFVLDKEYRPEDLFRIPFYDPTLDHKSNYLEVANFVLGGSSAQLTTADARQRYYWVFPPPVDNSDTVRAGGVPLFNGSQPVVGVEVRQMLIAPRF